MVLHETSKMARLHLLLMFVVLPICYQQQGEITDNSLIFMGEVNLQTLETLFNDVEKEITDRLLHITNNNFTDPGSPMVNPWTAMSLRDFKRGCSKSGMFNFVFLKQQKMYFRALKKKDVQILHFYITYISCAKTDNYLLKECFTQLSIQKRRMEFNRNR